MSAIAPRASPSRGVMWSRQVCWRSDALVSSLLLTTGVLPSLSFPFSMFGGGEPFLLHVVPETPSFCTGLDLASLLIKGQMA